MKLYTKFLTLFLFLYSLNTTLIFCQDDSLLAVVLMVKDEERVIVETLKPFVQAGVNSYLIYDTGSTDNTCKVTKDYLESQNINNFFIIQEPFTDFATSRNRALRLTEQKFPKTAFMIMLDAEWYMQNIDQLLEICKEQKSSLEKAYLIKLVMPDVQLYVPRLFRCNCNVQYKGVVHEYITDNIKYFLPDQICFVSKPKEDYGLKKSKKRWEQDLDLLLNENKNDPYNSRNLYYLAQTYMFLQDWDKAIDFYKKRVKLRGYDEENFMAQYRLAYSLENKALTNNSTNFDLWQLAHDNYLKAYEMRPNRIEPLIRVAFHYLSKGQYNLAHLYAYKTLQASNPKNDILNVEQIMYDFSRYYILSQTSLQAGDYEIGEVATRLALKFRPDDLILNQNLKLYLAYNSPEEIKDK